MLAFIVFITLRGELPIYLNLLRGAAADGEPVDHNENGVAGDSEDTGMDIGDAAGTAAQILSIFSGGLPI